MIDEAHNVATVPSRMVANREEGTTPTDFIRLLMDEVKVGIVLAGVGVLEDVSEFDEALASRTVGFYRLPTFSYDKEWGRLLKGMVQQAQHVDLSILMEPETNRKLYKATEGNLRTLKRLMTEMVLIAVDEGATVVGQAHLYKAYAVVYGSELKLGNPFESVVA